MTSSKQTMPKTKVNLVWSGKNYFVLNLIRQEMNLADTKTYMLLLNDQ